MLQFPRAMGLEVTLASYVLPEELILRARGVGGLGVREQRGQHPFPSLKKSTVAENVASQSKCLLPRVSGFMATATSVDTVRPGRSEESMVVNVTQGRQPMRAVIVEWEEEDGRCAFGCVVMEIENEGVQGDRCN